MFENIQFISIAIILCSIVILVAGKQNSTLGAFRGLAKTIIAPAAIVFVALFCVQQVPAGHVKVAALFGKVQDQVYEEGLHFPVNPLYAWNQYDVRQKTIKFDKMGVPSQDQLISHFDVSLQYRIIGSKAPEIKKNTGTSNDVVKIHVVPYFRSLVREQGKTVANAEEFYSESVQNRMQVEMMASLTQKLQPIGIEMQGILIRNVILPPFIATAVEDKKRREQEAEKQKAELKRFTTEQEQKIATANAEFEAAKLEEQKIRLLADAEAYKIDKINKAAQQSPAYIQLKQIEAWDGILPKYVGGENMPILDLRANEPQ
ncbi:prohibitin family protein [Arenicella sp. 4NH20-0111]|uniref:SPFH domain-containing protein n=1 Tax=Arenicella sp. 4NH20-0111 TaxID=3127648 RepID=UPI0031082029